MLFPNSSSFWSCATSWDIPLLTSSWCRTVPLWKTVEVVRLWDKIHRNIGTYIETTTAAFNKESWLWLYLEKTWKEWKCLVFSWGIWLLRLIMKWFTWEWWHTPSLLLRMRLRWLVWEWLHYTSITLAMHQCHWTGPTSLGTPTTDYYGREGR